MIRRLNIDEEAEFDPPTSVYVAFPEQEAYTFNEVCKAMKAGDGSLFLEFKDKSFAEIKPPYKFFQIGTDIDHG